MDWKRQARQLLRAELAKDGVNYAQLAARLNKAGINETARSIPNKMSRGAFSFAFFLQCMHALGRTTVTLDLGPAQTKKPTPKPKLPAGTQLQATGKWLEPVKLAGKSKASKE